MKSDANNLAAQLIKNPPAVPETWVRSLGWEDPLEKEMATYSSILASEIPTNRGARQSTVREVVREQDRAERLHSSEG